MILFLYCTITLHGKKGAEPKSVPFFYCSHASSYTSLAIRKAAQAFGHPA